VPSLLLDWIGLGWELIKHRTSVEEELVEIWTEILGLRVGVQDNFFGGGGIRLLTKVAFSQVRKTFGWRCLSVACLRHRL